MGRRAERGWKPEPHSRRGQARVCSTLRGASLSPRGAGSRLRPPRCQSGPERGGEEGGERRRTERSAPPVAGRGPGLGAERGLGDGPASHCKAGWDGSHPGWAPRGRTGAEIAPEAGSTDWRKVVTPLVRDAPRPGTSRSRAGGSGDQCLAVVVTGGAEGGLGPGVLEDWPPG